MRAFLAEAFLVLLQIAPHALEHDFGEFLRAQVAWMQAIISHVDGFFWIGIDACLRVIEALLVVRVGEID